MSSVATGVHLHEDRLLPSAPEVRAIAREIHAAVRDLPVLSPHGHVDAALLRQDWPRIRRLTARRVIRLWESRLPGLAA